MNGTIAVLVGLIFFISSCISPGAVGKSVKRPRFCPDTDVWILIEVKMKSGESLGKQPIFVPKGDLGATSGSCPKIDSEVIIPAEKGGKIVGEVVIEIPKGYLDNPKNVFRTKPQGPKVKKKPVPRPKRKRRIPPADNIRTWHANN